MYLINIMGNKLYSESESKLENFDLQKIKKIPLNLPELKKTSVLKLCFCPFNEYVYIIFHNNSNIYKYSLIEDLPPSIYTSHE